MYDTEFTPPPLPPPPDERKQSGIGIASFAIGLLALLIFCLGFVVAFGYGISVGMNNPTNPQVDQGSPLIVISSLLMTCGAPLFNLVGIGLGIGALVQNTHKKTLGIVGLVLNGLVLLSVCALFAFGLANMGGLSF